MSAPKNLFILSGLGADERVFQNLDLSGYSVTYAKWEQPSPNDTIENYAARVRKQITQESPVLIGLSFGGLIAIEVAKQIETEKVILVSSVKTKWEIPFYYRLAGVIGLHKLIPAKVLLKSNFMTNWFFGTSSPSDRQILKNILSETSPVFLKWALGRILKWTNILELKNVTHIHGTKDRILPISFVSSDHQINGGGHLMILNRSEEITAILKKILEINESILPDNGVSIILEAQHYM